MSDRVEALYQKFEATCRTYLPSEVCQRIRRAYEFARQAHGEQKRKSGEPYITHPITVAHYLAQLYVDEALLTGALLHDVAEDTPYSLDDIEGTFGEQTRHLVEGVTHLANVSQLEDIAHLFLAMSSDVRVVLIKLYDRLHNMRTLEFMPPERRRRKALETLRIYVPLAGKLGMWQLKTEFETLILSYLDSDAYDMICKGLDEHYTHHSPYLERVAQNLQSLLRKNGIAVRFHIKRRSPYRIYENMNGHKLENETYSQAFQIILLVDTLPECYLALGYIHDYYPHISGSLADTIGNPRDIFYRSLHTTIIDTVSKYKSPVNLRIRTYEHDRQAEIGIITQLQFVAAHEAKQPTHAPWLPELPQIYSESDNPQKFVESVFQDILQKHITCFTPKGKELSLPRGATVLDFAYHVHTDIGHECRGAWVNRQPASLNHPLADGDHVEIIRSRHSGPYHEWLDDTLQYAITSRAKHKIREWFRKQDDVFLIRLGRDVLREERRRLNAQHVTPQSIASCFNLDRTETLYRYIGTGVISASQLAEALLEYLPDVFEVMPQRLVEIEDARGQVGWLKQMGHHRFKLARCCNPLVGDKVLGHIHESRQITMIHHTSCRYILNSRRTDMLVHLAWLKSPKSNVAVYLRLEGYDRGGLIRDISVPIAAVEGNIIQLNSHLDDKYIFIQLKLELPSKDLFIPILHRLAALQNITLAQRMNHADITVWQATAPITTRT